MKGPAVEYLLRDGAVVRIMHFDLTTLEALGGALLVSPQRKDDLSIASSPMTAHLSFHRH